MRPYLRAIHLWDLQSGIYEAGLAYLMHPALQLVVNFQEERRGWSSSAPCVFWQGEFRIIEPKFPVRPVLRFSFRRKRQPLLPSPPPYPNAAQPARPALSVAQLLLQLTCGFLPAVQLRRTLSNVLQVPSSTARRLYSRCGYHYC